MSRTTIEIPMRSNNVDGVLRLAARRAESCGYKRKIVDSEEIWVKGDGGFLAMQCIAVIFTENSLLLQGWLRDPVMGEYNLSGIYGWIFKKKVKNLMAEIETAIINRNL